MNKKTEKVDLTSKEKAVIEALRKIGFGEIRIVVNDNVPVRIEEIRKSIKL